MVGGGQVVPERQGDLMLATERPLGVGHCPLQQRDGPLQLTRRPVRRGEIVPHRRGDQMVGTQRPLAAGQRLLQHGDGLRQITRRLIGGRQFDLRHNELGILLISHCPALLAIEAAGSVTPRRERSRAAGSSANVRIHHGGMSTRPHP